MKKFIYSMSLVLATSLVACTEDYKDWAEPQQNEQPEIITFGNGSVSAVDLIDFANIAEGQELVKVCNITAPTASSEDYNSPRYELRLTNGAGCDLTSNGEVYSWFLKEIVEQEFGKAPKVNTLKGVVEQWISNGETAIKTATSNEFEIKAKLTAPVIEEEYYFVGTSNDWNIADATYKFNHSDKNVYDDPYFTVTVPAPYENGERVDNWFKIVPKSAFDAGSWDGLLGCEIDGDESLEGQLIVGGNALKMPAEDGAKFYKITLNMMEYSYTIEAINFEPYAYLPGDANGWSFGSDILLGNGSGQYAGYAVLGGTWGWKVTQFPNWDNGDYGFGGTDGTIAKGGGNIMEGSEAKPYWVEVDFTTLTYKLTEVTAMSLIGTVQGSWDTDVDMTWDAASKIWVVTADLNAGEFKFRVNHDWGLNLGGDNLDSLWQNGSNMQIAETGNYTITLYPSYDGASHCTVVKN